MARFSWKSALARLQARLALRRLPRPVLGMEELEGRVVPATIMWINSTGGSWGTASYWNLDRLPTTGDDVVIPALSAGATITYSSGTVALDSLSSAVGLTVSGGTLSSTQPIQVTGNLTLAGGTISQSTISAGTTLKATSGTLSAATVNGNWTVDGNDGISVSNGLTLNGSLTLGDTTGYGYLDFEGSQTLGGTATVTFGSGGYNGLNGSGITLTIGSGITVQGQTGYIGFNPETGGSYPTVIDQGSVSADVSGGTIYLDCNPFTNQGTLSSANGGELSIPNAGTGGTINVSTGGKLVGTLDGATVDGNWTVDGNNSLTVKDGLTLNGSLTLGDGTGYGYLDFQGSPTLGGVATITFGSGSPDNGLIDDYTSGSTLTIGAGITVQGQTGYIGYSQVDTGNHYVPTIINQGTIDADVSGGEIDFEASTLSSPGILAVSAGTEISVSGVLTNTGQTLSLSGGGTYYLEGGVTGGTLAIASDTTMIIGSGGLNGVTVDGDWTVHANDGIFVSDGLTLNGSLTLGDSSGYGYLNFLGSPTLGGAATITFGSGSPDNGLIDDNTSGSTLTIGAGITIQGQTGYIGYSQEETGNHYVPTIINQGTIDADVSGGEIDFEASTLSSPGILAASAGTEISVSGVLTNTGQTLSLSGGGTYYLEGGVTGGTLAIASDTTMIIGSGGLNGVTVDGDWTVHANDGIFVSDGLTLNGSLTLGDSSGYGYLNFLGSPTLGGAATITFGSGSPDNGLIDDNTSGSTLTIGAGITIQGQTGYIGYSQEETGNHYVPTIINQGTIDADVSGGEIDFEASTLSSPGILAASAGTEISVSGVLTNTGQTLSLSGGGTYYLEGGVTGGTLAIASDTTMIIGSGGLNGVTVDGDWTVHANDGIFVSDGLTLNGSLTLGDSSGYGYLNFLGSPTLGGAATITFGSGSPHNGLIDDYTSGSTLTIGAGITVQGQTGYIGYSQEETGNHYVPTIINQGAIDADVNGGTLYLDATSLINPGTLAAANGGELYIPVPVTNEGIVSVDGTGTLDILGTIAGGTIKGPTGPANGVILGYSTWSGVTLDGNLQLVNTSGVTVTNGLTINGTLTLGNNNTVGWLGFTGNQTLSGNGSVILSNYHSGYYNGFFWGSTSTVLTIGPNITVGGGVGYIGGTPAYQGTSGGTVINQGTISSTNSVIDLASSLTNSGTLSVGPAGTLALSGAYTQSPSANFDVVLGGSTPDLYGHVSISGTASLNGNLQITETNNFSPGTGTSFTVLTATSTTGQFSNYAGLVLSSSAAFQPAYSPGNVTLTTVTDTTIAPDLRVTNLAVSTSNPQSSQIVTVNWDDLNDGNGTTGGSWTDHVVVTDTTTGQVLATANVPYNAASSGNLAVNGATAQSYSFRLPDGPAGVGNLSISVTTNYTGSIVEYYPGNTGYTNNTTTITAASTLAAYPDLQVSSLTVAGTTPQSGQNLTVNWADANTGQGPTSGNWIDTVTVVNTTTGQTLANVNVPYNAASIANIPAVGTSPQLAYTFRLPDGAAGVGTLQITVTTNATIALYEYNSSGTATSNNTATITTSSALANYPDLTATNVALQSPASPQSGNQVTVGWNDTNVGDAAVTTAFNDYVLVQRVGSGNSLSTIASGYVSDNATIAAGGFNPETYAFTLPNGAAGSGTFLVTITTDSGQTVLEYDSSGNPSFTNNTATANFTATLANYPDLTATNVALQSPASPQSGNQVTVGWNDTNVGDAAVTTAFNDYVLVQRVGSGNSLSTIASGYVSDNATIAAGGFNPETYAFTLPNGAAGSGTFLVTITTDSGQTVLEYDSNGNPSFTNNTATANFTATLANYPDLTATNVALQSPASPQSGNQVTVGWNDTNVGDAAVTTAFNDYVLVQRVGSGNSLSTIASGYVSDNATIAAGGFNPETYAFTLPNGAAGSGTFLVTITTDSGQTVLEYDSSGNPSFTNNIATGNFSASLANYPDVHAANTAIDPSSVLQSGGTLTIDWNDSNLGPGATSGSWYDQVVVVNTTTGQTLANADVARSSNGGPLEAGQAQPQQYSLTLPNGNQGAGNLSITVTADAGNSLLEYTPAGVLDTNRSETIAAQSQLAAYPDLHAGSVAVGPTSVVESGASVTIEWEDSNVGTAGASGWSDQVKVVNTTTGQTLVNAEVARPAGAGLLATYGGEFHQYAFTLPNGTAGAGQLRITVTADGGNSLLEYNSSGILDTNRSATITVQSALATYPDLTVANLTAAESSGGLVTATWADVNAAGTNAVTTPFDDQVTLTDTTTGQQLGSTTVLYNPATAGSIVGGSSTAPVSTTLQVPTSVNPRDTLSIEVQTNVTGSVFEVNTSNNTATTTVTPAPLPELVVSGVSGPASGLPGQTATVTWTLSNQGGAAAAGPWAGTISLATDAAGDNPVQVGTFAFSGTLALNGTLTRSSTITLPQFQAGMFYSVVHENADDALYESTTTGDTGISAQPISIANALTLALSSSSVTEGGAAATATVTRNGNTSSPLTVTLASTVTSDLTVPSSVTIAAGQSSAVFPISAFDDHVATGTLSAQLTAAATGFVSGTAGLAVGDADQPTLTLAVNPGTFSDAAGTDAATATVTRNTPTTAALVVSLQSDDANKVTTPTTVTIPAGRSSTTFPLTAVNDDAVDGTVSVNLSASSAGFASGATTVQVTDANVPTLTVALAVHTVSEAGGEDATTGTVSIGSPLSVPLAIALSSSDTTAATVPALITIPAGSTSMIFGVNAIDDGLDLGNKTAVITAQVETSAGVVLTQGEASDSLVLQEVDGAALSLSFPVTAINKGTSTTATVTRNTSTTAPLVVTLSSSDPTRATVDASVTIPAGQASTTFTVNGIDNHVTDGLHQVVISASAGGLNTGVAVLGITDTDLPDLTVSSVTPSALVGDHDTLLGVSWTIANTGLYAAVGTWYDEIFLDPVGGAESSTPVTTVPVTANIAAGQIQTFTDSGLTFPSTVGSYTVRVVTDASLTLPELSYANNTGISAQPIVDQSAYTATVAASTAVSPTGAPITLSGTATLTATGAAAADVEVSVRILVAGTRRVLTATTDANGNYSVLFQPLPYEAGSYSVAAADPAVTTDVVQTTFEIVGLQASPASESLEVVQGTPLSGTITLTPLGGIPLTGLTATAVTPSGVSAQVSVPAQVSATGSVTLSYTFTAAAGASSGTVTINLSSDQGAALAIPLTVTVVPLLPDLVADPGSLNSSMVDGSQTLVPFTITNTGGAASGDLQVELPTSPFLSLASSATIPSLAPGASTTVTLELTPAANLPLDQYTGTVVVASTQTGLSIPYVFQATSSATGSVQVIVDDDLTYQEAGSPHVSGATVELLNPFNQSDVIATGTSDASGSVLFSNVPAGPYVLDVSAPNHSTYSASYTVATGVTSVQHTFIAYQAVSYTWAVTPTTIQDSYSIQLQTVFQTQVPVPVVTIVGPSTIPTLAPGQSGQILLTIADHGLLAAQGLQLELPTDPEYTFTALTNNLGTLAAESTIIVPVTVTRSGPDDPCGPSTAVIGLNWDYLAGGVMPVPEQSLTSIEIRPNMVCVGMPPPPLPPLPPPPNVPSEPSGPGVPISSGSGGEGGGGGGSSGTGGGTYYPISESNPPPIVEEVGVYAPVTLAIDQTATLTRSAFTGTLTLDDGETGSLTNVQVSLNINDSSGNPVNSLFSISAPALTGLTATDGTGTLPSGTTGSAVYTIIPDDDAAPTAAKDYEVGGTLSYTDPTTGLLVTVPLTPSTITVYPQPSLQINYFLQRNVIGDDPFTPETEPAEPTALGVLVTNVGGGTANNLELTTAQPKITSDQEGLPVVFQIIGTKVGSDQLPTPSLTADFGNVVTGQTADAEFELLSSIQGDFTDFTASFEHADALGGTDTSLISSITTHMLIHAGAFNYPGSAGSTSYLTEEVANPSNLPDTVYLANGTTAPVTVASGAASTQVGLNTYQVTATVTSGWDYIDLTDPDPGETLTRVVRSDGTVIPVSDMAWTTDRTFGPDGVAILIDELHILDLNSTGSYTVTFAAPKTPPTSSVQALPPTLQSTTIPLSWSGRSAAGGAPIYSYDIYYSDDGSAFTPIPGLLSTTQTSGTFTGQIGHTYGFFSVARDENGNVQTPPSSAQASTLLEGTLQVTSVSVNGGEVQRSEVTQINVTFSSLVTLTPGAFTFTRQSDGASITDDQSGLNPLVKVTTETVNGATVATLTFLSYSPSTLIQNGSLADGVWVLTVNQNDVNGVLPGYLPMASNYSTPSSGSGAQGRIYRLFGDVTGQGSVNGVDFSEFAAAYNAGPNDPNYNRYFDFSNSGEAITSVDFTEFSDRYGTSL